MAHMSVTEPHNKVREEKERKSGGKWAGKGGNSLKKIVIKL